MVAVVALVLRGLTVGRSQTVDETAWMRRTAGFWDALARGDIDHASASVGELATMPGITTMWVGTIGRGIWGAGRGLGMWREEPSGQVFGESHASITIAQATMAVLVSLVIAALVVLVRAWIGRVASVIAGLFLATEPFLVAHGAVLHTDEPMALLGLLSMIATALAVGVPRRTRFCNARGMALIGGAAFGLAVLTKISALFFLPSVGLIAGWAVIVAWPRRHDTAALALLRRSSLWWIGAGIATIVVLYPALWVDPGTQLSALWRSAGLGSTDHLQFFRGEITGAPSAVYYLVAVPMRVSPWLLLAGIAALLGGLASRAVRPFLTITLVMVLPSLLVLSLAAKKFDRYALIVPAVLAVLVGGAAQELTRGLRDHFGARERSLAAGALGLVLVVNSAAVAPWGLAYFNPLLGGSEHGEKTLLVGWGEGLQLAGSVIERREAERCDDITIWSDYPISSAFPCGVVVSDPLAAGATDYLVLYVSHRQRTTPAALAERVGERMLVERIHIRGIRYVDVYQ